MKKRGQFATKFGVLMATVGSAVGLGNVWRFPYQVGDGGGGAYILIYAIAVLLIGIPAMTAEFILGRESRSNAVGAFKKLSTSKHWSKIGYLGVFTGFVIDCYYCVVAGWTFHYLCISASGMLLGNSAEGYNTLFTSYATAIFPPILAMVAVIIISGVVISLGVRNGIEKASKVLMPLLFIMLVVLSVNSCLMEGAKQGLSFLFVPKLSNVTFDTILGAIGQAFFSLSLGMACLVTYSSYFGEDVELGKTAVKISVIDMLVAILSGVIIFPAVFTFGMAPEQGAGLVFKVLPNVFSQMPLGYLWSVMFYILLFIAAITSFISIFEVVVAYIAENFNISRLKAVIISSLIFIVLGSICSLSLGPLNNINIFGLSIFDTFDFLATSILLPVGGILTSLFVGWKLDKKIISRQLNIDTQKGKIYLEAYVFALKYIVPLAIASVLIVGLIQ